MAVLEDVSEQLERHPALIALAILVVAILAWLQSRATPPAQDVIVTQGVARGIDPNAAAIEQAAISAHAQELGTIAQLVGMENTNSVALAGSLAQTGAARDVALAQTNASIAIASGEESAQLAAARITADTLNTSMATNAALERARIAAQEQTTNFQTQAGKDIARANANAGILNGITHAIGSVLAAFGF